LTGMNSLLTPQTKTAESKERPSISPEWNNWISEAGGQHHAAAPVNQLDLSEGSASIHANRTS